MGLVQTTPPAMEPVSLTEMKAWSRVVETAEDSTVIEPLIASGRSMAEEYTQRQLMQATWLMTLDAFPKTSDEEGIIHLKRPPLISVTHVKYYDVNGVLQTLDASRYEVDIYTGVYGRIKPAYGLTWPTTRKMMNAVQITYLAGYGDDPSEVPQAIRDAIKLLVTNFIDNRTSVVVGTISSELPSSAMSLLAPFRVREAA